MTCHRLALGFCCSLSYFAFLSACGRVADAQPPEPLADSPIAINRLTADAILWKAATQTVELTEATDDFGVPLPAGVIQRFGPTLYRQPTGSLQNVSFCADNRTIVSFGRGTTAVPFIDARTGRSTGHLVTTDVRLRIGAAAASTDGQYLAVSATAYDRDTRERVPFLKLFRTTDHHPIESCTWSTNLLASDSAIAVSNDGRYVAKAGPGKLVQLWKVGDAAPTNITIGQRTVDDVMFSTDSELLIARTSEKVYVWDLQAQKTARSFDGFDRIQAAAVSDSNLLAVTDDGQCVTGIWDLHSGRRLHRFRPSDLPTYSRGVELVFAPGSKTLIASYAASHRLETYSVETGEVIDSQTNSTMRATDLAISPDGKLLAVGASGCALAVWQTSNLDSPPDAMIEELTTSFRGHNNEPFALTFSADGKRVMSVSRGGEACVWEMGRTAPLLEFEAPAETGSRGNLAAVAISPNRKYALTLGFGVGLDMWDLESGGLIYHLPGQGRTGRYGSHACGFSADGKQFYSFGPQYYFRRWDTRTGKAMLETRPFPGDQPVELDANGDLLGGNDPFGIQFGQGPPKGPPSVQVSKFSVDGSKLFFLADRVYVVATKTGKIVQSHDAVGADHLAVSDDGNQIATSAKEVITIRSKADDSPLIIESEFSPRVVAFSADGSTLAAREHVSNAFASESWFSIFDTDTGEKLYQIDKVASRGVICAFTPDGKQIATTLGDSTILLFDLEQFRVPQHENEAN